MIARRDFAGSYMGRHELMRSILKLLKDEEMYGYAIRERLQSNGVRIELTNLYKLLADMEKKGLVKGDWQTSETGPKRRVYRLSAAGKVELNRTLMEAAKTVHEFYRDYLSSLPARISIFKKIDAMIERALTLEEKNSAIVVDRPHVMNEYFTMNLCKKIKDGRVYLAKPPHLNIQLPEQPGNLTILAYIHNRIPLKDGFLDSVRALALPFEDFEEMLKEFHRILKKEGCLFILMPHLKHDEDEPLSIGDFLEKIEHGPEEEKEGLSEHEIITLLNKYFAKVESGHIAHTTVFTGTGKQNL